MKKLTTLGAISFLLVLGIIVVLQFDITAAQENQGPPKDMADYEFFESDYHRPGRSDVPAPTQDVEQGANSLDYTLLTFMSARDYNWEIYKSNRFGYDLARLTNHSKSDITPRLNRGSTRIVFASNRSGNYEIYSMNPYGSDVRQLTNNSAADSNPAWSFDGASIVFVSERDGQAEIYKMNADGGGQTRLTYDGAYDGDPRWSPDGSQIVFASRRNGHGIWLMDANGGNQHMLVQRQYSQNPVFSPDGSKIAFDADGSGDGWQEIWLMDSNGSNQRIVLTAGQWYDPYVSGWSPDGTKITFTLTYWTYYQGNWYWVYAKPSWVGLDGWSDYFNYDFTEDWYPDWQSTDIVPPNSAVHPLRTYSGDEITVQWSGSDGGGSGIERYDIQFRQGNSGSWQDWYLGTSSTSGVFGSIPGKTVYFRSRAYDRAGQVEEWPEGDGDTHTTFYSWKISGTAMDNRMVPLPGVVVTTTQEYFELVPSDVQGAYGAYFAGYDLNYTITFDRDGYGTPVTTTFPRQEVGKLDILMPPADNIIANPDFEIADFNETGWTRSGIYTPTLNSEERHTGEKSVFFGREPGLENVAHFLADVSFSDKAAPRQDASGQFHVVWHVYNPEGGRRILYANGDGDGNWSAPVDLVPFITNINDLHWDVTADGRVHVIWEDGQASYDVIRHVWKDDSGWHGPEIVYNIGRVTIYAFRLDSAGGGHMLWRISSAGLNDALYSSVSPTGDWSAPERLYSQNEYEPYNLVVDHQDVVHLQWSWSGDDLLHNYRLPNGNWTALERVALGGYNWTNDLLIDDNNGVHLVWGHTSGKIYHSKRQADGTWLPTSYLSTGMVAHDFSLQAIAEAGGGLAVAWLSDNHSCRELYVARIDPDGAWIDTSSISIGSDCLDTFWLRRMDDKVIILTDYRKDGHHALCQVTIDATGVQPHGECLSASTNDYTNDFPYPIYGNDELVYYFWRKVIPASAMGLLQSRTLLSDTDGESKLEQQITIPPEMTHPTLSFVTKQGLNAGDPELGLKVAVDDGITETIVFTGTWHPSWNYSWLDLEEWSGQQITLTFSLQQKEGEEVAWAYLDEVFLGSAYPDCWLDVHSPFYIAPGSQVNLTIHYGNRSDITATGLKLTAIFTEALDFVTAAPEPSQQSPGQLEWDLNEVSAEDGTGTINLTLSFPESITSGQEVPLSFTLVGDIDEPITENNSLVIGLQVSHVIHLPLILR